MCVVSAAKSYYSGEVEEQTRLWTLSRVALLPSGAKGINIYLIRYRSTDLLWPGLKKQQRWSFYYFWQTPTCSYSCDVSMFGYILRVIWYACVCACVCACGPWRYLPS